MESQLAVLELRGQGYAVGRPLDQRRPARPFAQLHVALREASCGIRQQLPSLVASEAMNGEAGLLLVQMKTQPFVLKDDSEQVDVELVPIV